MKSSTIALVVLVFIIYVLAIIIIQNKKRNQFNIQQAKRDEYIKSLKNGDYVITMSGIYGYIKEIKNNKVSLEISKNTIINMDIQAIMGTLEK